MESDTTHYLLQFKFDEKFSFKNYLKELSAEQIEQNEEFRELKNQVDKKLNQNDKMNINLKDNQLVIQEKNQNNENIAYEENFQNQQEQYKYDYSEKEDIYYIEVLENNDLGTVKKNYVEVMEFIGRPINFDLWININDETKGDQERKNNFRKNQEKQKKIQNEKRRQKLEELLNKQQKYETVGLNRKEIDDKQKANGKKKSLSDLYLEQKYSKKYKRSTKKQDIQKKCLQKQDNYGDDLTQISILDDISFQNDQKEDQYQQEKFDIEMSYQPKINKNNKKIKNDCNFNYEKFDQDDINFNVQELEYWEPSTTQVLGVSGLAGIITNYITYPIEFIKTRIQVRAEGIGIRNRNFQSGYNPHKVFRQIHATGNGFSQFYYGIESFLASRVSYLLIRNFLYKTIYDRTKPFKPTNDLSHREKAVIAGFAGATAAFATTPLEQINTRFIADGGIHKPNRRNYQSIGDAWSKISSERPGGLFRGGLANVIRAVVLNVSLTGPYDYLNEKSWILFGEMPWVNNTLALIWASIWGTLAVTPFDNLKTRMMIQFPQQELNRIGYKGYMDCIGKIFQNEGIFSFWVGTQAMYYKVFLYSALTLGITNSFTRKWKQEAGLESWQI
ncbi:Mitochondrial carrier domain [Pseudocohnilembus persalinus]|uniref:Mitochondrial carrier domain n=1 Tax=Pseudocohnilembus persalinus TaxID=266149 RepID=A0A0V0R7Z5_PSEPJ|nr:Mitochondrial carrier domain [Pseudocohnilembus persalinus]|eukprot:KRX10628.1 Mitochondrial carrier domain [Pseudocohnilembus persalinus]